MAISFQLSDTVFSTKDHAKLYSRFRNSMPQSVLDYILEHLKQGIDQEQWNIAVDVGCGGGQSTHPLAEHFKQVYGFDVSEAQIKEAIDCDYPTNIHYEVTFN